MPAYKDNNNIFSAPTHCFIALEKKLEKLKAVTWYQVACFYSVNNCGKYRISYMFQAFSAFICMPNMSYPLKNASFDHMDTVILYGIWGWRRLSPLQRPKLSHIIAASSQKWKTKHMWYVIYVKVVWVGTGLESTRKATTYKEKLTQYENDFEYRGMLYYNTQSALQIRNENLAKNAFLK